MKFGIRTPSLKRRFAARTSIKRMVRAKIRMPRGTGFITNPKKAAYNAVYNRTSVSVDRLIKTNSTNHMTKSAGNTNWLTWGLLILFLPITFPFLLIYLAYRFIRH